MKTFILTAMLAVTAASGVVVAIDTANAGPTKPGGVVGNVRGR
jgi:hypothetical protein